VKPLAKVDNRLIRSKTQHSAVLDKKVARIAIRFYARYRGVTYTDGNMGSRIAG
jgi:hypothetical protein